MDHPPQQLLADRFDAPIAAIFSAIASTAPVIRDGLSSRRRYLDADNPSGETQLAADVFADELLCDALGGVAAVGWYGSEERSEIIEVGEAGLTVCVDPLDGSTNLRPNASMGTVVGVYARPRCHATDLLAAGYVLYGPIMTMVTAVDGVVTEWLVETEGTVSPLREQISLPSEPRVYGFGGRVHDWTAPFTAFVRSIEHDRRLKLRYGGAMIGDVNQVLTYGGIFGYPMLVDAPQGKLRTAFEAIPVGAIIEAAGGRSSDGSGTLLQLEPDGLHARTPVFVGNPDLIGALEARLGGTGRQD
jgi:D-fructose 1,6-bisphosphatase (EC 3.1.3.11)